jgi:type IV secretory pathway ATPase VirB11/archaellum biosynthesis ATPase
MAGDPRVYLEGSFLKDLLALSGVTDISYNGKTLNYVTNEEGRKRSSLLLSTEDVGSFLRQIANLSERQFSYSCPILDVSFGPLPLERGAQFALSLLQRQNLFLFLANCERLLPFRGGQGFLW